MFKMWRASTIVFVLQAVFGLSLYIETGNVAMSATVVAVVTFLVMTGIANHNEEDELQTAVLPAFCGSVAVACASIADGLAIAAAVSAIMLIVVWLFARIRQPSHRFLSIIAALPLGIGTVLGGLYLSWRAIHDSTPEPLV